MFHLNKRPSKDMLEEQNRLLFLSRDRTASALNIVTTTIEQLENVNETITRSMDDIKAYRENLDAVSADLDRDFQHNTAIIENFRKLLNL